MSLLGAGRQAAGEYLKAQAQKKADEAGLGVEIVFLGLQGVHPPPDVATDYRNVIAAVQKKQAAILSAEAQSNTTLTSLTGSIGQTKELSELAQEYQEAEERGDQESIDKLNDRIRKILSNAKGEVFKILGSAEAYAFQKAVTAEATGKRFKSQVKAYRASPNIYKRFHQLSVLEEILPDIRKYVIVAGDEETQIYIINLEEKLAPSIYDFGVDKISK
jgi:regulator of protease activity HflC (stomatin/prohibitin superfamily)